MGCSRGMASLRVRRAARTQPKWENTTISRGRRNDFSTNCSEAWICTVLLARRQGLQPDGGHQGPGPAGRLPALADQNPDEEASVPAWPSEPALPPVSDQGPGPGSVAELVATPGRTRLDQAWTLATCPSRLVDI